MSLLMSPGIEYQRVLKRGNRIQVKLALLKLCMLRIPSKIYAHNVNAISLTLFQRAWFFNFISGRQYVDAIVVKAKACLPQALGEPRVASSSGSHV